MPSLKIGSCRQVLGVFIAVVMASVACEKPQEVVVSPVPLSPPQPVTKSLPAPKIPSEGRSHRPALSELAKGESYQEAVFMGNDGCGECHGEVASQWSESVHSFASLSNPIYLVSFDSFLKARGAQKTKFCAGCHDPALMFNPTIELTSKTSIPQAHQGVGCLSCHGVQEATREGNGSYVLSTKSVPVPKEGDQKSLQAHLEHVRLKKESQTTLCVSCHRGFLTPEMGHDVVLAGLDELGPWRRSAFNGNGTTHMDEPVKAQDCVSCHMPKEQGFSSHRFAGGHSSLAAMMQAPKQLDAIKKQLQGSASLEILPVKMKGDTFGVDVVIFNERVGHNFPGGAKDLRDTWVEVVLLDPKGRVMASSGLEHEKTGAEPYTYILHARLADASGSTQREHNVSHFRTPVYDHTIAPRDAHVARYAFSLPKGQKVGKVTARLRHRRLAPGIFDLACKNSKTPQGQQTLLDVKKFKGKALDPCTPQPIVEISQASFDPSAAQTRSWLSWYRYGLGLLHHVHENLEEARVAFNKAKSLQGKDAHDLHKAMVIQGLGDVSARQGRTDEAVKLYKQADELNPGHPSTWYKIGAAYKQVWRFKEAATAYEKAAGIKPDTRVYRDWSIALGSTSRSALALEVAQLGLLAESRDAHLLRSQMLAYRNLGASEAVISQATQAFEMYKRDEKAPHVRDLCSKSDDVCRAERQPIGTRWLRSHLKK